jgi:hypothetical protein
VVYFEILKLCPKLLVNYIIQLNLGLNSLVKCHTSLTSTFLDYNLKKTIIQRYQIPTPSSMFVQKDFESIITFINN